MSVESYATPIEPDATPIEFVEISGPRRSCVACRKVVPQSELLRFVAVDGAVAPDPGRRLPGRGAWLHDAAECRALAERRHALERALRLSRPA